METVIHPLPPFFERDAEILILGTMPSPKSRELNFYYMHPQNRFWRVLADVFCEDFPKTLSERKALLRRNRIALWDVLASCEIRGASDATIRNPVPNDIEWLLTQAPIRRIYTTGKTAEKLYCKFLRESLGRECILLPSTSPANCRMNYSELFAQYQQLTEVSYDIKRNDKRM